MRGIDVLTGLKGTSQIFDKTEDMLCSQKEIPGSDGVKLPCFASVYFDQETHSASEGQYMTNVREVVQMNLKKTQIHLNGGAAGRRNRVSGSGKILFSKTKSVQDSMHWLSASTKSWGLSTLSVAKFRVNINPSKARYTEEFARQFKIMLQLPKNNSLREWKSFFQAFGTHYASELKVGGTFEQYWHYDSASFGTTDTKQRSACLALAAEVKAGLRKMARLSASGKYEACKGNMDSRSVEKMLNDFASTKEVKGGDNRAYKTGDPEDAYNRWQNSINAKTGEGSATRLIGIWNLIKYSSVPGLSDFNRKQKQLAATSVEENFYKYIDAYAELAPTPRPRFERFHEEMPHSANSQPPPAMHWALLINGLLACTALELNKF